MRILDMKREAVDIARLFERSAAEVSGVEEDVRRIVARVRAEGDAALLDYTARFDCRDIERIGLTVGTAEIENAYRLVSRSFVRTFKAAQRNVTAFHRKQKPRSWVVRRPGARLQQRFAPLDRIGIYVPGGKGAYLSTVMMNAVPAGIAGVKEIVMASPCNQEGLIAPEVLVAAAECGVTEIYRVGGAQAIAALAYGTASIPRVHKITGPGNAYVAAAKKLVFGQVGIDMIAGPTEVVIVADDTAPITFLAADLIAQAEHDELATPVCITTSGALAKTLPAEVERQLCHAPRKEIAGRALAGRGAIVLVSSRKEAVDLVNRIAPEHLEVMVKDPDGFAVRVRHAGSIFLGPWSSEALGDYAAGPNHTLPTSGTARFSSPLGVNDFMKFTNVITFSRREAVRLSAVVEPLARAEGFFGHAASAAVRRKKS